MSKIKNVLFIMTDQMRADCLGSEDHPVVRTPNLDWLASRGVRFDRAYVQTAVCAPSRMCFYTGRYTHAHRSYWNEMPLPADETTLAQCVREAGIRAALCGKTHHTPDEAFLRKLNPASLSQDDGLLRFAGFEPWEVNDFWGEGWIEHLRSRNYELPFENLPLAPFVVHTPNGEWLNGWRFEAAAHPTVVQEEDSDTAFMTRRAMEFVDNAGDEPWLLHLSYLKPHWPNVAPDPYHSMYDPASVPVPVRDPEEIHNGHPLLAPFREERRSIPLDREEVWRQMRATYYGLITQIDDHLGKLFEFLEQRGRLDDTLIIFTSDHGEYMGDHWLFEKELFYEQAVRVPLIVYDPSAEADPTRGSLDSRFVESIDILPTCLDAFNLRVPRYVQGRSILPLVRAEGVHDWRDAVFGDWDFRFYQASEKLALTPEQCRAWMVRDERFKYVHFNGLPAMLFDLQHDPDELNNLAADEHYKELVQHYQLRLLEWRQSTEDNSRGALLEEEQGRTGVSFVPDDTLEVPSWLPGT